MRRVLVTGANKGIGLANVLAVLSNHADAFVLLGSRDLARGEAAKASLGPALAARVEVLQLDVASAASVQAAAAAAAQGGGLYGALLNAGTAGSSGAVEIFDVNLRGVQRCVEAFAPLLTAAAGGSRLAVVSSGVASMFVAKCAPERVAWFRETLPSAEVLAEAARYEQLLLAGDDAALIAGGYYARDLVTPHALAQLPYYASKAFVTAYTQSLAAELPPSVLVNCATPGFIETDLVGAMLGGAGPKAAAAMGALPPERSTPVFEMLLFGEPGGRGLYFGSDAKRSPMHRYRAPGSEAYDGGD